MNGQRKTPRRERADMSKSFQNGVSAHINPWKMKLNPHTSEPDTGQMCSEQAWKLQRVTDKRVKNRVSEGLSPEGKIAMEQTKAEVELPRRGELSYHDTDKTDSQSSNQKKRGKVKKQISFVDAYEHSSASRLSGDLLDEVACDRNQRRRALGGGNVCVAMETVEIVSYGETPSDSEADDIAIEEKAKLNSVEKCLVWMGVHMSSMHEPL